MAVVMVLGAPASSKSSHTKTLLGAEVIVLNRDTIGGSIADLLPIYESHLKNGDDVLLDNLFPTVASRKPFIELAKKYNNSIVCEWLTTSIEDSTFNAIQRAIKLTGNFPTPEVIKAAKHPNIFPPAVLFKYKKEFEKPTLQEGFSSIKEIKFERKDDPSFTTKAAIFDYDGTLRECVRGNGKFPTEIDQIRILPGRKEKLQSLKEQGYLLLGMSNQSGVHKKELTYEKTCELFDHTNKLLGIDIDYKFCPHQSAPISCFCRKPLQGLFIDFMMKYKLSRKDSFFVGDMTSDRTTATRCGIKYYDQADFFK